jgi:hypothetical protein
VATISFIGNAADVRQISTITLGGTWLGAETATVTCNGKDIVVTIGTGTSTANVAIAIKEALAASKAVRRCGRRYSSLLRRAAWGQESQQPLQRFV